jgi:pilus assembly protein CpaF
LSLDLDIVIESDDGGRRAERLTANGPVTIGRDAASVLRLESDLVSRHHAVVQVGAASMRIEDRSTNGTLAGGQLLRKNALDVPFGTPVVVGNFTLHIQPVGAARLPEPAPLPAPQHRSVRPPPAAPQGGDSPARPRVQQQGQAVYAPPHAPPGYSPPRPPPGGPAHAAPPTAAPAEAPKPKPAARTSPTDEQRKADIELRREIHRLLLEHLDLATMNPDNFDDPSMRPKVLAALRRIIDLLGPRIPPSVDRARLVGELADEALGLGPLERFIADETVSEIMVIDADTIYVEQNGRIILTDAKFTDDERVRAVIERIVTPLGRRIDESSPLVDARLKDGSRVNAVIRPIALRGSCITIRKFAKTPLTLELLYKYGSINESMGRFLSRAVVAKKNIIISGGTGSGKTTLLNVLSNSIPPDERIVTIEDAAELQLGQPHVVSLETRPANMEGKGEYSIRDLLKNAMRMRPDRIVVGECRGGEALDMLQAMNTGHDGSLTTTHANSPEEALARLETLALMAGVDLPSRAIREQIAASVHLIVQQSRFADGTRRVTAVSEVVGIDEEGQIELLPLFEFVRTGTGPKGEVLGSFRATGYLPSFLNDFIVMGLVRRGEAYM